MKGTYTLLPPDGHLAVPVTSRRAAKAGLTMYTACKRSSLTAQRAAWHAVSVLGPRVLPGRRQGWRPPVDPPVWDELVRQWRSDVGPFDDVVLHLRRPAYRAGASLLLLRAGAPIAFVKLRADRPERLEVERRALDALDASSVCFVTPSVLSAGTVQGWHHLTLSPLPARIHTMIPDPPLARICQDLAAALAPALPRPAQAGADWRPAHGDLTPWNLRALDADRRVLFDWEDAVWAPPGADLLWYDAVIDVKELAVRPSGFRHSAAAARFWIDHLTPELEPGRRSLAAIVVERLRSSWLP